MGRVAILVDGMYLQHACDLFGTGRIDPTKLPKVLLREGETFYRTYWFDALPYISKDNPTDEQKKRRANKFSYFEALRYKEGIVIEEGYVAPKFTECFNCGEKFIVPVQKMVDVKISVRLVQLAWSKIVDKMVLLAGDADLVPAVEASEQSGTTIRLAYISEGSVQTSRTLVQRCPEKHQLKSSDLGFCTLE
ncbi:NYN domain-containing protein [Candidatus Bathyarchaeota archaeon]|nr:NYN domain-containing protein [Candidatus Bathyarchaeota archaeon]